MQALPAKAMVIKMNNVLPLRVGIIGAGFIAGTAHLPSLMKLGTRIRLVAIADNRPEALKHIKKYYPIEKTYTDPYEMLRENELDLVHICTANNTHKEFTIAALRSGANVLCEKPLALTVADTKEMFQEADKAGKLLIACQNNRMGPMQKVKELIENGVLGNVYYTEIENIRRRGVPAWGRFHTKEDNGGGPLCDVGVHYIDAALFAVGNPKLVSVSANTFTKIANRGPASVDTMGAMTGEKPYLPRRDYDYHDYSVEDFASGIARFENGMQMMIKFSWALNLPRYDNYKIVGDRAGLVYEKSAGKEHPITLYGQQDDYLSDQSLEIPIAQKGAMHDVGHELLIHHLADVLQNGEKCVIQREEMLNVVAVMEAFYLSGKLNREIRREELSDCQK